MDNNEVKGFGTKLIHAGHEFRDTYGALSTPIYQTSTFCFNSVEEGMDIFAGKKAGYAYTRGGNPTIANLEKRIAVLENGEECILTSSGMGAISGVLLGLLKSGDHLLCGECVYGCTDYIITHMLPRFGIEVTFVNTSNLDEIEKNIKPNTKMIYFETITNPTMVITDIKAVSEIAHKHNILVTVDNTFSPPPQVCPIDEGADFTVHSCTKYINGHGDVISGAIIGKKDVLDVIRRETTSKLLGTTPSPFEAFLMIRGLETMELRMMRHCENGLSVAKYLESEKCVKRVYYPGLESHEQYNLAKTLLKGNYGGMLAFELNDEVNGMDGFEACKKMINHLKVFNIAVSLGDPASLIQHPASMTHANISAEERKKAKISDSLIRVSCGLENSEDLINDLKQAFASI